MGWITTNEASTHIGYVSSDHILFARQEKPVNSSKFLTILDVRIWIGVFLGVLLLPLICSLKDLLKAKNNSNIELQDPAAGGQHPEKQFFNSSKFFDSYFDYFWRILVTIMGGDQISILSPGPRRHVVLLCWVIFLYLLESYFTGDLISSMANPDKDFLIGSWDDLVEKLESGDDFEIGVFFVGAFFDEAQYRKDYFPPGRYRDVFTNRITIYQMDHKSDFMATLINDIRAGKKALMFFKPILETYAGPHACDLHISRFGGRSEPYFILYYPMAFFKMKSVTNKW